MPLEKQQLFAANSLRECYDLWQHICQSVCLMQLSRPLWIILAIACALILLASNAVHTSTWTTAAFDQARSARIQRRDLSLTTGERKTALPHSSLLAFVGVFTALKPERRQALRSTWFPSSETDLLRQGQSWQHFKDRLVSESASRFAA